MLHHKKFFKKYYLSEPQNHPLHISCWNNQLNKTKQNKKDTNKTNQNKTTTTKRARSVNEKLSSLLKDLPKLGN